MNFDLDLSCIGNMCRIFFHGKSEFIRNVVYDMVKRIILSNLYAMVRNSK